MTSQTIYVSKTIAALGLSSLSILTVLAVLYHCCAPSSQRTIIFPIESTQKWKLIAINTNSHGGISLLLQRYKGFAQGWDIAFDYLTPERRLCGSMVEKEAFAPCRNLYFKPLNNTLELRLKDKIIGSFNYQTLVFEYLNGGKKYRQDYLNDQDRSSFKPISGNLFK